MGTRMPVLFVGHGSPLYAIEDNEWSRGFRGLATLVPRPKAVLMRAILW
jgi:4,5-DOPA dioxygenase extradiol